MEDYITTVEARKRLHCSPHFLSTHIRRGNLKGIHAAKPGTRRKLWLIDKEDFERFLTSDIATSSRVGREMYCREPCRQPTISRGYVQVYKPGHHRSDCNGYVPEHILVAEQKFKRKIKKTEDVHHLNGKRTDNRPENLEVYSSRSKHLKEAHGEYKKVMQRVIWRLKGKNPILTNEEKLELINSILRELYS